MKAYRIIQLLILFVVCINASAQKVNWTADGLHYTIFRSGNLVQVDPRSEKETVLISSESFIPDGSASALNVQSFEHSPDGKSLDRKSVV